MLALEPVRIGYHEPAAQLRIEGAKVAAAAGKPADGVRTRVGFSAFGREFDIELEPNDRLYERLRPDPRVGNADLPVYRGSIHALPGSWARIALVDGIPVGAVWDGSELFLIDTALRFGISSAAAPDGGGVVVVRANDVRIPTDTIHFAASPGPTAGSPPPNVATGSATAGSLSVGVLPIGLVLDAGFISMFSDPLDYALAVANVVDGIFVAQLSLHLDVAHVEVYGSEPDPFSSSVDRVLLGQLASLKAGHSRLRPLALAHLLTRIDMGGDIVGIANIGRVCHPEDAVGITRALGGITTALIMAHEIGHNLGAYHDGESGSVCASTPTTYLMAATISQARSFSPCSIRSMTPVIAGAACKTALPQSDVRIFEASAPGPLWYGEEVIIDYRIQNTGTESTIRNRVDFSTSNREPVRIHDVLNRSCEPREDLPASACDLRSIGAGQSVPVAAALTPLTMEPVTIDAVVSATNDSNLANNTSSLQFEVLSATDLRADAAYGDGVNYAQPGWTLSLRAGATNAGDFETTATISVSTEGKHRFSAAEGCMLEHSSLMHCAFGSLAPGTSRSVDFELHVDPDMILGLEDTRLDAVHVEAHGTLHDIEADNDRTSLFVRLVGSIHDLELGFTEPPQSMVAGQTGSSAARIRNNGPDAATDLVVATYGSGLEFTDWQIGGGECAVVDTWLECRIARLDSGEEVELSVSYTSDVPDSYRVGTQVYSEKGLDTNYDNGWRQFDIAVKSTAPAPEDEPVVESGGGGSFSWQEFVLLLALTLQVIRVRHGGRIVGAGRVGRHYIACRPPVMRARTIRAKALDLRPRSQ